MRNTTGDIKRKIILKGVKTRVKVTVKVKVLMIKVVTLKVPQKLKTWPF